MLRALMRQTIPLGMLLFAQQKGVYWISRPVFIKESADGIINQALWEWANPTIL
jgi:hypothetical protein